MKNLQWDLRIQPSSSKTCARFFIEGERKGGFELIFDCQQDSFLPLENDCTPALLTALIPAMRRGVDLVCHAPVDPLIHACLPVLIEIFSTWMPSRLQPIKVIAKTGPARNASALQASFFSGGGDSWYSFYKHKFSLSHIIHVQGFDYPYENNTLANIIQTPLKKAIQNHGKNWIGVKTNMRNFTNPHTDWGREQHGIALGAIASLFAGQIGYVIIPATYQFKDLIPYGTHPTLDPLFATSGTSITHDGIECSRVQKLDRILQQDDVKQTLRVCFLNTNKSYNCGHCVKCIVTMMAMLIADKNATFEIFSEPLTPESFGHIKIKNAIVSKAFQMRARELEQAIAHEKRDDLRPYLVACKQHIRRQKFRYILKRK